MFQSADVWRFAVPYNVLSVVSVQEINNNLKCRGEMCVQELMFLLTQENGRAGNVAS